ncbi:MAG: hypothetical protein JNL38_10425 [Myxococcales bacterium]|nr:hypothetical protein [Myxococcales bacterium]
MITASTPVRSSLVTFARVRTARRVLAAIVAVTAGAGFLLAAGLARADELAPLPSPGVSASHVAPAAPGAAPSAPAGAAPAAPVASAPTTVVVATNIACTLGEHAGVDEADARTAADIVCHDLASKHAPVASYEVRFGKLGSKLLLVVRGSSGDERRALLTGVDEVPVGSQRVAAAIADGKPLDETITVSTVLHGEARPVVAKPGRIGFNGGTFGVSPVGQGTTASPGVDLGLLYNADRFGLTAQGRLAPALGTGGTQLSYVVLGTGGRFYFTDTDVAPFAGVGVAYSSLCLKHRDTGSYGGEECGAGFGAYAEAGLEALRTHRVTFTGSVRADVPFYALRGTHYESVKPYRSTPTERYAVPVSLMVGMVFH